MWEEPDRSELLLKLLCREIVLWRGNRELSSPAKDPPRRVQRPHGCRQNRQGTDVLHEDRRGRGVQAAGGGSVVETVAASLLPPPTVGCVHSSSCFLGGGEG